MSAAGNFFAIDRRAWAVVCDLGMNAAVCYLVMARGTGGDQRTTSWSVNAIESHTGIGRPRAQKALKALESARAIRILKGGSRPRYFLVPPHEIPGAEGYRGEPMTTEERTVWEELGRGPQKLSRNAHVGLSLVEKRCAKVNTGNHRFERIEYDCESAEEPDWIWLPNTIVDGAVGEPPPVERIRQAHNVAALRLFGDLYHAHALTSDGGVNWRPVDGIRQQFERLQVGQRGPYVVWGFVPKTIAAWPSAPVVAPHLSSSNNKEWAWKAFWNAWTVLTDAGLVELVAHLVEGDIADAEVIHPLPLGNGEQAERAITEAACRAAMRMVTEGQASWAIAQGAQAFAPVAAHIAGVQLVGIARMRYRPKTRATALWFSRAEEWGEWAARYETLEAHIARAPKSATSR